MATTPPPRRQTCASAKPIGVAHVGLTVSDLDAALSFWEQFLERQAVAQSRTVREYHAQLVGIPGIAIQLALLEVQPGVSLELLQYDGAVTQRLDEASQNPGHAHLCLSVADLEDALDRVRSLGARLVSERPIVITAGLNKGVRASYVRVPPDGHTVELFQLPATVPKETGDLRSERGG
jgi:catechol 2,3-dioxygenase-like lactoylglutathione lyase family enzyme